RRDPTRRALEAAFAPGRCVPEAHRSTAGERKRPMTALRAIRCVWLRHFDVYRKSLTYGIVTTFAEPLLYLFSFGFGLGSMIGTVKLLGIDLTYRQFI